MPRRWNSVCRRQGYADGGYAGPRVANASPIRIQVVRKPDNQAGFSVIARRWIVERLFAWINRNRRLAKDLEASMVTGAKSGARWVRLGVRGSG